MTIGQTSSQAEQALRARVAALEAELAERSAQANAAVAAAQERTYWLDRYGIDMDALMRRRGASELRTLLRVARRIVRGLREREFEPLPIARVRQEERELAAPPRGQDRRRRLLSPDRLRSSPVTDVLHGRLDTDPSEIRRRLNGADAARWDAADGAERKRLDLAFAVHHGVPGAPERTGLSADMPPEGVHAMGRGSLAAGGSYYYADLVVDALTACGLEVEPGTAGLDFGCSSARVVRVLAAAYPEIEWHACDPISDAIEWARGHVEGVAFELTETRPPLPYDDAAFDFAFAISIWSHFGEAAALAWLSELWRVLRPGGRLLLTTHGLQTIAHAAASGARDDSQLSQIERALYDNGYWFAPEFGEQGDHGIRDPEWGTAFLTPEWLASRATPDWRIQLFRPGRVEDNQDLYVLERR